MRELGLSDGLTIAYERAMKIANELFAVKSFDVVALKHFKQPNCGLLIAARRRWDYTNKDVPFAPPGLVGLLALAVYHDGHNVSYDELHLFLNERNAHEDFGLMARCVEADAHYRSAGI